MRRRLRRWGIGAATSFAVVVVLLMIGIRLSQGHVVPRAYVPNHRSDFDFTAPPCSAAERNEADEPQLRYLGVSGLYVEWRGSAILMAPFFSSYGLLRAGLGKVRWDDEAIRRGMAGLPLERIRAVLVGHAHYDHVADLPPILSELVPRAQLFGNRSSTNLLAAFRQLDGRLTQLNEREGEWIPVRSGDGEPAAFRFMALRSDHARHVKGFHYARGAVDEPWNSWNGRSLRAMREGETLAFLIDLLEPDGRIAFRMHYQDAASSQPLGFPPDALIAERNVDLAVVCMANYWEVERYPQGVLERTAARHVLVTHYEDFFRSRDRPLRFVPLLTDGKAERFFEIVSEEMARPGHEPIGPTSEVCGPSGDSWTMPLPGEWLSFGVPRSILGDSAKQHE